MRVGGCLQKLRRDAHALTGAQHSSLHHGVDSQLSRDFRQGAMHSFVMHRSGARNHAQRANFRQMRDQSFCESIGEIFLLRIAR